MSPQSASTSSAAWSENDLKDNPHRAADKADRVQRMFAAIAPRYDLNNRLHSFGRDQAWRRAAVRLAAVQSTDNVLDVACGTGDLAEAFAKAGAAAVVGIDFTQAMLDVAVQRAARLWPAPGRVAPSYRRGDAMDLPFEHASFDIVSIAFGIRNVADPARALSEFKRVLRPGGRLVVLEFSQPANPLLRAANSFYTQRIMPLTATLIAHDRSGAYRYLPKSISTFCDRAALARLMEQAGFRNITQHPMTFGVCVAYLGHVEP
jgi:demethylmenaquinone methyltransferase/2-methoxy-6-polyprenyl-1,4-benzoquinol methylase